MSSTMIWNIGVATATVVVLAWLWRVVDCVYWTPRRLDRMLRAQGLDGTAYRLLTGDFLEEARLGEEAKTKPLEGFSHRIVPRVLPFHHAVMNQLANVASISANLSSIPVLNGSNFKDWKENILIVLGCMDLDLALRVDRPASLTDASSHTDKVNFEKWDRSNRMSLMIIKRSIPEAFRGTISEKICDAKDFLAEIEKRFVKNDKAETSTLLQRLISMTYKGKGNVREYIMGLSNIASKLKALKLELSEDLLVHLVLLSLPTQFSQFKISYNCQKEQWTLNELIAYCVQEEERLKQYKTESANLASASRDKGKKRKPNDAAKGPVMDPSHKKQKVQNEGCFFCSKPGHAKKDCTKYHAWRVKKGLPELPKAN